MPRKNRDSAAGTFHVFTHCVWAAPRLYRDATDRIEFLRHLAVVGAKVGWTCVAYCLMDTHYHLIVDAGDGVLPTAMHGLNLRYARYHNRRYGLRGHAQFERYGSRRVADGGDLLTTFAYVARNPVKAELCAAAHEWRWSSYRATVGLEELPSFVDPARVLRCFPWPTVEPAAALRAYVEKR
jgi:REP element-mobilizing transposase RayT